MNSFVICKVNKCPFKSSGNFCKNPLVSINSMGHCSWIYDKKDGIKAGWDQPLEDNKENKNA